LDKNKYLIGMIGLAIGFICSFFWTQHYNKVNDQGSAMAAGGQPSAKGAEGQQAQMGQVQQTIDKAKANPRDYDAQVAAASLYSQIGRKAESVEYLLKAYAIDSKKFRDLEAFGFVGQYYFDEKNYQEAEKWFRRASEAEPNDSELHVAIAETLTQREPSEPDRAIDELQRALKINAKDGHALGHLVEAYALKNDARDADETLNRLKEADPKNARLSTLETLVADLKAGKPVNVPKE
jgi:tetratricopeptide (TPR) repeat protein